MKKENKTAGEMWNDPNFKARIKSELDKLIKSRNTRPIPNRGLRYRRDWYDRMEAVGALTPEYFLENIKSIWVKRSSISREFREVVEFVCWQAIQKTLIESEKVEDEQEKTNG